ncbi:MAG: putative drug exporter of the superfamily [Solirubrobacteraceae bacterium]|nr:putative drug exporter of the superfamily [Solirubrobacteraceae bacterium]
MMAPMQALMLRFAGSLHRHRRLVLAGWAIVLVAALPFAARQSDRLTGGGFAVPGSQAEAVQSALEHDFAAAQRAKLGVVLIARGAAGAADQRAALERVRRAAARVDHVAVADAALARAARGGAHTVVVPLRVDVNEWQAIDVAAHLRKALGIGSAAGSESAVTTHLVGQGALWAGLQEVSKKDLQTAEGVGFPIVALILLFVFGSLAAAALPLALGFVSVIVTGALIYLLSRQMEMSVFTTNMASMIGIGVAVDYSLFILARYREEIAAGRDAGAARGIALATSGVAVLFSGMTVVASLAGLLLVDTTALRSMALGAILVVAVSVLTASTLLPALISILGPRAHRPGRLLGRVAAAVRARRGARPPRDPFWQRWTTFVMRRPLVAIAASASVLLVLAVPTLSLKTADGALDQFPRGNEIRAGFAAAAQQAGPGALTPVVVVARTNGGDVREPRAAAALRDLRATIARDPQVVSVGAPVASRDGGSALLEAATRADGERPETKALVERLRGVLPAAAPDLHVLVGGTTAGLVDFNNKVSGSMWLIVLFVLSLSYVVLMVLLRSAVLPLKAVVMNLLSVGAAYGVVVAAFQWGWVDGLFGFQSLGHVDTITPPLVLAVVFGLSMDYEVFLLTRIRERYAASGDTRAAVAGGLAGSARTITSAALIMVAVFATFIATGVPSIQQIGLGTAVAIALDATLVRLVLVPAAMAVMGRWNWWLPRPLQRILPRAELERFEPAPQSAV